MLAGFYEWEPLVPNPDGLRAFELLTLHRQFWKKLWAYTGADCRFPWGELAKDAQFWIGLDPKDFPGPLRDPSNLGGSINKAWISFFYGQQNGTDLVSKPLFFRRILAANPIDPSESEEVSRERYTYDGREVWLLTFDGPVKKSHARKMEWLPRSIELADYLENGRTTASLVASNPLGLPIAPKSQSNHVLIDGEILQSIQTHTNQLDDNTETKSVVLGLVHAYNDFAAHLPAETERGAWFGAAPPLILPKKPTPIHNILAKLLLPPSYFQSVLKAPKEGTYAYLEEWVGLILQSKILHHDKSSTLLGGETGVIWAVLVLVLLLFNFDYVCKKAPLPVSLPEGCELSKLYASECDRAIGWCRTLTQKLRASQEILRQSSPQRLRVAPSTSAASNQPIPPGLPSDEPAPTPLLNTSSPPKHNSATKPSKRAKTSKTAAKANTAGKKTSGKKKVQKGRKRTPKNRSDSEDSADFTDNDSEEHDYDEEDRGGSSEEESEDDFGRKSPGSINPLPSFPPFSPPPKVPAAVDDTTLLFCKNTGPHKGSNNGRRGKPDEGYMPIIQVPGLKAADCPWGRFPDPTIEVTLPSPLTRQTLYPRMQASLSEIDQLLAAWKQGITAAEKAQVECCRGALDAPNPAAGDPYLGSLVATVRAREFIWNIQKAQGNLLFPTLERLSVVSSTALQLTMAAADLIKRSKPLIDMRIENACEWQEFSKFDQAFRTKVAEGRWTVDEMEDYALLATKKANEIDWFPDSDSRPTFDKPAMRKLATWCMEWTKETGDLEQEMLRRRRRYWATSAKPFLPVHQKVSQYKLGNAEKQEWHKDLETWLADPTNVSTPSTSTGSAATSIVRNDPPSTRSPNGTPQTPCDPPTVATDKSIAGAVEHPPTTDSGATSNLEPGATPPGSSPEGNTKGKEGTGTNAMVVDGAGNDITGDKPDDQGSTTTRDTIAPGLETTSGSTSSGAAPVSPIQPDKIASNAQATKPRPKKSAGTTPPEPPSGTRELRSATKQKSEADAKATQKRTRKKK